VPRKVLAKKSTFDVNFENPFSFVGKPVQDSRLPDFNVMGSWGESQQQQNQRMSTNPKLSKGVDVFNINSINFAMFGGSVTYGGGTRTANISEKTLEKSGATLIGMAPKADNFGNIVQGFNYANPNYRKVSGANVVKTTKKEQFANALDNATRVASHDAKNRIYGAVSLPQSLQGGIIDGILNDPNYKTPLEQANADASSSRVKQASKNKIQLAEWGLTRDPTIVLANQIQSELGRDPITNIVTRRRRGRWDTSLSEDPIKVIRDYNKKKTVIDWAKNTNPDLQIDPERKVRVVDVKSSEQVATYWTHNGRSRKTGTKTVDTSTYKNILATELPKGDQMDMLYEKIETEAKEKKKKYLTFGGENTTLYQPRGTGLDAKILSSTDAVLKQEVILSKVKKGVQSKYSGRSQIGKVAWDANQQSLAKEEQKLDELKEKERQSKMDLDFSELSYYGISDETFAVMQEHKDTSESNKQRYGQYYEQDDTIDTYSYYGIKEEQFKNMDRHKTSLISNIRNTDSVNYGLKESLASSHRLDATTPLDDNSPKQKYLTYQKTGQDSYITPTVQSLKSQIAVSQDSEKQNLLNSISFVEGKSRSLKINGSTVATRDNLGRITVHDSSTFSKYIKNTPAEYLKQADTLDAKLIPELEKDNDERLSKFTDIEKEYYKRERAKAQFAGSIRPKRIRKVRKQGGKKR
tara:strand:- start:1947 stop:4025 length:2079 start_codon:yes stop_codon:yes gene_type:complete